MIKTLHQYHDLQIILHQDYGVIGYDASNRRVHMTQEKFLERFKGDRIKFINRNCTQFPIEAQIEEDGFRFFCLFNLYTLKEQYPASWHVIIEEAEDE